MKWKNLKDVKILFSDLNEASYILKQICRKRSVLFGLEDCLEVPDNMIRSVELAQNSSPNDNDKLEAKITKQAVNELVN